MTADEMFEKLGYKKAEDEDEIWYLNMLKNAEIAFIKDNQEIVIKHMYYYDGLSVKQIIDFQELKAINQKCKELGWLENDKQ